MISIRNAAQQESKKQEKRGFRRYQTGWRRLLGSPREERTLAVEGTIGGRPLLGTLISIHRIESNGRKKTHIIIFPFSFVTKKKEKKNYKSVIKKERQYASASKSPEQERKKRGRVASLLCYPNLSLLLRRLRFHHSLHPNRFAVQSFPTDLPSGLRNRCSHCGGSSHESFCSDVNFSSFFFIYFGSVLDDRCGFFLDVRLFGVGIGLWFLICWAAAGVVGLIGFCFGFVDVG